MNSIETNLITRERFSYPMNNVKAFIKTDLTSRTMQSPLVPVWEGFVKGILQLQVQQT